MRWCAEDTGIAWMAEGEGAASAASTSGCSPAHSTVSGQQQDESLSCAVVRSTGHFTGQQASADATGDATSLNMRTVAIQRRRLISQIDGGFA